MDFPAPQLDEPLPPASPRVSPGAPLKFTYPSGSRPLDGFTIKRGVGRGGFGEVYFATSDAGKEVALKLIRRNLDVELRGVTQCLNLKHPNLIALYDIRTDEMGDQWVIMEYVSGESLEDIIDRHPSGMPVDLAVWWMRGICSGVAYLHDHGIVHRDLKPGNIFSDDGTVKIGDYGLAKFISCSRRSGQTESVGTVHYMAPEIANGRYGREIDTYALGIILFEMLTGRVPFEGECVGEVLMKHLTAEPDLTTLEEPYQSIVARALAKDPNVRIDSVGELASLLPATSDDIVLTPVARPPSQPNSRIATAFASAAASQDAAAPPKNADLFQVAHDRIRQKAEIRPSAETTIEEPVWKAIRGGADYVRRRWAGDGAPPMTLVQRILLVGAVVLAVFWLADNAWSLAVQALMIYGIYYVIWSSFIKPGVRRQQAAQARSASPAAAAAFTSPVEQRTVAWPMAADSPAAPLTKPTKSGRRLRPSWRDRAHLQLAEKPLRIKFQELVGSMLLAAAFAFLVSSISPLVTSQQAASESLAAYLWLALVGTIGSWAVMIPAKLSEGRLEDHVPMRMTLLILGALVGAAAWFLQQALLLNNPSWGDPLSIDKGVLSNELLKWPMHSTDMFLAPQYYVAYFAFLFLLPRWWRQTEFTRDGRLSLWWVVVCVGWAWLLHFFWWFPQPQGMMVAGVIALATQLSSPWMPPSRRKALAAEIEGGVA